MQKHNRVGGGERGVIIMCDYVLAKRVLNQMS